jgi:hypothetical protein
VELVEVDAVGAEATQAILSGLLHVFGPGTLPLLIHRAAELRGNHHFVTAPTERAT